jgi:hypothetical protein
MDDGGSAARLSQAGIGRRALLLQGLGAGLTFSALGPAALARTLSGVPAEGKLAFQVWRNGAHIGEHDLKFEQDGDELTVQINVRIVVRVGPVPVMKYTHSCKERWSGGGAFLGLESVSHSNLTKQVVSAKRSADGIWIQPASGDAYTVPGDTLPMSHWNRQMMKSPLFNPQDGKVLKESSRTVKGKEMVKLADGSMVEATRYAVTGDASVDDWYDAGNVWTALHGRVVDGSYIDYLRL